MGKKLSIFFISIFALMGLILISLFASMIFSIKQATSPIQISGSENIAILEIEGIILSSSKVIEKIAKIKDEPNIKAVIVRINSPGGAVGPSQEIYSELLKLKEKMPVFASLETVAASGGYYVAAACDKILTNPGTLTGSIGVIMNFVNFRKVYDFLKLDHSVIKSGNFKDIGSGLRDMKPEEKIILQSIIDDTFKQFTDAILANRKITPKNLKLISDGRILTGLQAKKMGLVDEIGTLNDTIEQITKAANMQSKPNIIYPLRKKEKILDFLLDSSVSNIVKNLKNNLSTGSLFFLPRTLIEVLYENY